MIEEVQKISAVILAGGKGTRFQHPGQPWQDKALYIYKDKTFLEHILSTIEPLVSEIILVTIGQERSKKYKKFLKESNNQLNVRVIEDYSINCEGPLKGIISGLLSSSNLNVITIPVDQPFLSLRILENLVKGLNNSDLAIPIWSNGKLEPLIGVYNQEKIKEMAKLLSLFHRGRADDLVRASGSCSFVLIEEKLAENKDFRLFFRNINQTEILTNNEYSDDVEKVFNNSRIINDVNNKESIMNFKNLLNLNTLGYNKKEISTEKLLELVESPEITSNFWRGLILEELYRQTGTQKIRIQISHNFLSEAKKWGNDHINFLHLHSLLDARKFIKEAEILENLSFTINQLFAIMKMTQRKNL